MKKRLFLILALLMCLALLPLHYGFAAADDRYLEINETNFPDANFRKWIIKNLNHSGDEETGYYMTKEQAESVESLDVGKTQIKSLAGIEHFPSLSKLVCNNMRLASLDVSKNSALQYLNCGYNRLTELDVSKNTALEYLNCYSNQLTELDVSKNTALTELRCDSNKLTELDVSKNTALKDLRCEANQLTELDVSKNTVLVKLACPRNQLTELDVSKNTALEYLNCYSNQLTELDVSKNSAIEVLSCGQNQLTALDVSKNTALGYLGCGDNRLTELNVSKNTALEELSCSDNQLTELDVSHNTVMVELGCSGNMLTELDLSNNTDLEELLCDNNLLTELDVSYQSELYRLNCSGNRLTTLDLSANPELDDLDCKDNQLTTLNLSNCAHLYWLVCSNNHLTELDLSKCADLNTLVCSNNALSSIIFGEARPWYLECQDNHLAYLDREIAAWLEGETAAENVQDDPDESDVYCEYYVSPQTIPDQKIEKDGDLYVFDLTSIMPLSYAADITITDPVNSFDASTGIVTFTEKPDSFVYQFEYGMEVTVSFSEQTASGQCGENLFWSFDERTATLTITGSGAMYDYGIGTAPWDSVRSEITAVVFPDGMTSVGKSAFYGCTGLTEIVIPDGVTDINDGAFRGCTGVTSITVPCSVRVVSTNRTFADCTAVTTVHMTKGTGTMASGPLPYISGSGSVFVILDDGIRNISDNAFMSCAHIAEITIPSSVTSIGSEAFSGCSGLAAITIPSSVTEIGSSAFYNCTGLADITIPSGVTSIGWGAFYGCSGLASVTIPSSVTEVADYLFYGCTGLPSVTIPSGVTSIGESAFAGCTGLKSVTIPSGVTNIEDSAFKECTGLPSIVIPDSVASIGMDAFGNCSGLKNVTMPCSAEVSLLPFDGSESIRKLHFTVGTGEWKIRNDLSSPVFQGRNMTAVLDEGIPEIGEYGFYRCSGLKAITIPSSVTSIGDKAFYACTGLPEITIPSSVTSIGKEAFRGCTGLRSASIDSGVIGESAFRECTGIESVTIGDAAESIGASAFYGCTQLTSVGIGGGVTGVGKSAFNNCRALTAITIPDSVTSIGESAFYSCVQLTSATIGDGVTDVGKNAFKECASLASVTMPCSASIGESAFSGCKAVTEVHLTKGTGTMTGYRPNTYEYTPWYVSRGNAMTVILDEGIRNIGSWVFYNCTGLTEITLPSSLISIDAYAFNDCKGLTEIVIPDNVTDIGTFAFGSCSGITAVTMPGSVQSIESGAFGCANLTDVYYDGTPQMRRKITIQHSNTSLLDAEWHYLPVNAIEWKTLPKKLTYVAGEPLSVYGGAITTYYDHDIVEEEPLTADMVTGFDSSVLGKQTLTVTFGGKTLTYEIEVIAQIQIEGTVEWNAEDVKFKGSTPYVICNGSAQTPRFTVKNSADGSVVDPENYDYEYRENTDAGTGYVIVTFKGDYSGTAQGWFKIYLPATEHTYVENVSNGIKVTWDPVEGAAGYVIYRRAWSSTTNGWTTFERWNNTTGTTYIDGADANHKVYAGSRYQYGVKAYFARRTDPVSGATIGGNVGDNFNLGEVGPLKTTVCITTRKLVQVRPGSKQMTVKWEASKNFTGYQIKYATDANFTKNVKAIKIGDPTTYWTTIKSLQSNTTYYVCIRSYHEFGGMTYFGEWSNVLSCKVK